MLVNWYRSKLLLAKCRDCNLGSLRMPGCSALLVYNTLCVTTMRILSDGEGRCGLKSALASSFLQNSFAQPFSFYTQGWAEPCAHSCRAGLANSGVCSFLLLNSGSYTTTWPPPLTEYLSKPPCGQPLCWDSQLICKGCGQSHPALFPEFHGSCSPAPLSLLPYRTFLVSHSWGHQSWGHVHEGGLEFGNGIRNDLLQSRKRNGWSAVVLGALTELPGSSTTVPSMLAGMFEGTALAEIRNSLLPMEGTYGVPSKGLVALLCICPSCFLMFKMGPAEGCEI